jgi:hypothetical protein
MSVLEEVSGTVVWVGFCDGSDSSKREVGVGLEVGTNIPPSPYSSQLRLMFGNLFLIASTCIRVGFVLPLKMLDSEAVLMPVILENVCWFMCCASISCFILSFM